VWQAFPGRNVEVRSSPDPFAEIDAGNARLALVGASAFFDIGPEDGEVTLRPGFEAVGRVGTSYVHALALEPELQRLQDAKVIATGPQGSGSYHAARTLIDGMELDAELLPFDAVDARQLAEVIAGSQADAAVLAEPVGNAAVVTLIASGARLLPVTGWIEGNNLIRYPYLRPARFGPGAYPGVEAPVETLTAQLVLAGPAETEERAVGDQGPGASFIPRALPLSPDTVRALSEALPGVEGIDPVLPRAAALSPQLPSPPAAINPAMDVSLLTVAVLVMLTWMGWLLFRPERR
jgi:osmoprotectant transport system permease protein